MRKNSPYDFFLNPLDVNRGVVKEKSRIKKRNL